MTNHPYFDLFRLLCFIVVLAVGGMTVAYLYNPKD